MQVQKTHTGRRVAIACVGFIAFATACLVYVCSRPATVTSVSGEQTAIARCQERAKDPAISDLSRYVQNEACAEMEKQFRHKHGTDKL